MFKACIVGCGNISEVHYNAIENTENGTVFACCDIDEKILRQREEQWNVISYNNYDDVLLDDNIDVIHICTPHYLHYEMIKQALDANKKVVCEKPVTMLKSEFELLSKNPHIEDICVVFQNRLNNCVMELKRITESMKYGKIISMRAYITWNRTMEYYNSGAWRGKWDTEGGGVLINQAIHTLDFLCYLAGKVGSVESNMFNYSLKEIEVEDTVSAYLKYKNGAICSFYATNSYTDNPSPYIEIQFEKTKAIYVNGKLLVDDELIAEDLPFYIGKKYWGNGHDALIKDFYDKSIFIGIKDVKNTMDTLFAMYESARSGNEIVIED